MLLLHPNPLQARNTTRVWQSFSLAAFDSIEGQFLIGFTWTLLELLVCIALTKRSCPVALIVGAFAATMSAVAAAKVGGRHEVLAAEYHAVLHHRRRSLLPILLSNSIALVVGSVV